MLAYETLSLPTPFPVGRINCYLIKNDPVTLIDCGVYSDEAFEALKTQLKSFGFQLDRIKQVLITHAHTDHFGLASNLQKYCGAKVYIHSNEMPKASNRRGYIKSVESYLALCGLPEKLLTQVQDYYRWELDYSQPLKETVEIKDCCTFTFDNAELQAILTPGHSSGHLCYYERTEGLLFSGDTLLGNITPNPLLEPSLTEANGRSQSLIDYITSLKRLKELSINLILPGHGKQIIQTADLFMRISKHHQERKNRIRDVIRKLNQSSPYEIAREIWPVFKRPMDLVLTISEVLGYVGLLTNEGVITEEIDTSGVVIRQI